MSAGNAKFAREACNTLERDWSISYTGAIDLIPMCRRDFMANSMIELAESVEHVFDEAVVNGDDNELFASGYLRGHFDLVVAQLELQGETKPHALWENLQQALHNSRNELNPQDQQHVQAMLQRLMDAAA